MARAFSPMRALVAWAVACTGAGMRRVPAGVGGLSVSATAGGHRARGPDEDAGVQAEGPAAHVQVVQAAHLLVGEVVAARHLPEPGDARPHRVAAQRPAADRGRIVDDERAGPDERHLAGDDVEQLGKLVEAETAQRRLSLDELPQLFNVVSGKMSLVGPRPFVIDDAASIGGWALRRYSMRPGITGLWQVSGRNDLTYEEMCRLDHLYVSCWSLGLDARILVRTARAVAAGRGAY